MSSASFFTAIKPDAVRTAEQERDAINEVVSMFLADTSLDRDELLTEARKVGFDKVRILKVTIEVEDELTETGAPAGEAVN